MKNLSLRTKMFLIFGALVGINILSVAIGLIVSNWIQNQYNFMVTFADELSNCLHTKEKVAFLRGEFIHGSLGTGMETEMLEDGKIPLGEEIQADVRTIFNESKGCRVCHSMAEMKALGKATEENLTEFLRVGKQVLRHKGSNPEELQALVSGELPRIYANLQAFLDHGVHESASFVNDAKDKVEQNFMLIRIVLYCLAALALLVALIAGFGYTNRVIGPLREMSRHFRQIAASVLAVAKDQSANASTQASAVVEVSAASEQLSRAAEALTKQAEIIVQVANNAMKEGLEVTDRMHSTVDFINTVKTYSDDASAKIMSLGETIDEIGKVLALIEDVASQTRLLAFNASIEAVSAGDAGRRFSIVAKHIKDLAENTSSSTDEIKKLIEEIRLLAHTTVLSTEQTQKAVNEGVTQVAMAGEAMEKIKEVIQENHEVAQKINIATAQQGSASDQITETMEGLSNAAQALADGGKQTVDAMKDLNEAAATLKRMIEG